MDTIEISDYRGIKNFKMDKIKPINIFVGRNNTGKSSILEAIAIVSTSKYGWYNSLGESVIDKIMQKRGGIKFSDTMINLEAKKSIIKSTIEKNEIIVSIMKNIPNELEIYQDDIINGQFNKYLDMISSRLRRDFERRRLPDLDAFRSDEIRTIYDGEIIRQYEIELENKINEIKNELYNNIPLFIDSKTNSTYNFELIISEDFLRELTRIMEGPVYRFGTKIKSSPVMNSNVIYMLSPEQSYLSELQRKLALSGELIRVIRKLREKIDYFEDLREVDDNFIIYQTNKEYPLPLESMGDGFRAQIALFSAISTIKNGIVIMEEPEMRLHPGYMISITEEVINSVRRDKIQYFISTHSVEFIKYMIEKNPKICDVVRVYRLPDENELDYEVINGEEALNEIESLELDLRGL